MNGFIRGNVRRPRPRFLLVETLEDRLLLSSSPPPVPVSGPVLPEDDALLPALAVLTSGGPSAGTMSGAVATDPTASAPLAAYDSSLAALAAVLGGDRLTGELSHTTPDGQAKPATILAGDALGPYRPIADRSAAVLAAAGPFDSAPGTSPAASEAALANWAARLQSRGSVVPSAGNGGALASAHPEGWSGWEWLKAGDAAFRHGSSGPLDRVAAAPVLADNQSLSTVATAGTDLPPADGTGCDRVGHRAALAWVSGVSLPGLDKLGADGGFPSRWGHEIIEMRAVAFLDAWRTLEAAGWGVRSADAYVSADSGVPLPPGSGADGAAAAPLSSAAAGPGPAIETLFADGPGSALAHEDLAAERPARPERAAVRAALEAAVLARPEGGVDALPAKDGGRAAGAPLAPLAAVAGVGLVDPLTLPAPGAPARDAERLPWAAFFLPGLVAPVAGVTVVLPGAAAGPRDTDLAVGEPSELPTVASLNGTEILGLPSKAVTVLEGGLPLDLPTLKQDVDAFFARLEGLGEVGEGVPSAVRFVPWLVLLSAAAFELARRRDKRSARPPGSGDEIFLGLTLLPEDER
jgi:hypothetical protein